jgi:hypothetical protein
MEYGEDAAASSASLLGDNQSQSIDSQEAMLLQIHSSVVGLHEQARNIGEETTLQNHLIDEIDSDVTITDTLMVTLGHKTKHLHTKVGNHVCRLWLIIIALSMTLLVQITLHS